MKFNHSNVIIVVGDLGAGANIIKNLILLSEDVDWPMEPSTNRLSWLSDTIYPSSLKDNIGSWHTYENRARHFKDRYQVDISNQLMDINTTELACIAQDKKVVLLTHWPEIALSLYKDYPGIKLVTLYPEDKKQLLWQIKSYIEKKTIEELSNFSFDRDIEQAKELYIRKHGINEYYKFNVLNMVEIFQNRVIMYKDLPGYKIPLSRLITEEFNWIDELATWLDITVDLPDAIKLINKWKGLHPPVSTIDNFIWFERVLCQQN